MKNKKYSACVLTCLLAGVMTFSLSACTKTDSAENAPASNSVQTQENADNSKTAAATNGTDSIVQDGGASGNGSKILIAYFTAAENSGVEAVSSASYTTINGEAVGRIRAVADMIQGQTGGDLFSIQTSTVYPADGGELIDQAADEQDSDFRPELTSHIENLDDYDVVFVGYPNWWYDMPMAMYSFFEEYDFSGKTVIPFNVHNGSRFSNTISTIQELEPGAEVIEDGFTVSEHSVADAKNDVQKWLDGLGY